MSKYEFTVNLDKKCKRCGKGGATDGGYCMACVLKNLNEGKYDHILKQHTEPQTECSR